MSQVIFLGWRPGLKSISLITLLQERANYSLSMAKDVVDRCLAGEAVAVEVTTLSEAELLAREASYLGAITEVKE
jgi:hypothetical protein